MNTEENNGIMTEARNNAGDSRSGNILIVTNVVAIISAIVFRWPLSTLLFPYWIQSVIIGYYSRKRILQLKQFSTEGFRSNGRAVDPTEETKRETANFFAAHFGFFHFIYLVFLAQMATGLNEWDWVWVSIVALNFIRGHSRMYRESIEADQAGCPNIGMLMFLPYLRIIPMHLIVILGTFTTMMAGSSTIFQAFIVVLFGSLKTAADYLMDMVEHKYIRNAPDNETTLPGPTA